MEWRGRRRSTNVEDRRGSRIGRGAAVGGGLGTLVLALLWMFLGGDPAVVLQSAPSVVGGPVAGVEGGPAAEYRETPEEAARREFVEVVLADTEDVWNELFRAAGASYLEPTLVLFSGSVESACGFAQSATGPFYCPGDQRVFLDMSFFDEMATRLGATGDFAAAYVIAHEVGHHVQTLLGTSQEVRERQRRVGGAEANALSVRLELQADCYAGVWAHHTQRQKRVLEPGDLEEALGAASAVGDDRLQSAASGRVSPDSFTHGSSEQRMRWFRQGFESGNPGSCDTFGTRSP